MARDQNNLAIVYLILGDYEQARELWLKAYDTFHSKLGENHPHTKTVREWLDNLKKPA